MPTLMDSESRFSEKHPGQLCCAAENMGRVSGCCERHRDEKQDRWCSHTDTFDYLFGIMLGQMILSHSDNLAIHCRRGRFLLPKGKR